MARGVGIEALSNSWHMSAYCLSFVTTSSNSPQLLICPSSCGSKFEMSQDDIAMEDEVRRCEELASQLTIFISRMRCVLDFLAMSFIADRMATSSSNNVSLPLYMFCLCA